MFTIETMSDRVKVTNQKTDEEKSINLLKWYKRQLIARSHGEMWDTSAISNEIPEAINNDLYYVIFESLYAMAKEMGLKL